MHRRWFWPLVLGATLLLSIAGGFLWSIGMVYAAEPTQMPRRITDDSVTSYSYYVDVAPGVYVGAAALVLAGLGLLVAAARLR